MRAAAASETMGGNDAYHSQVRAGPVLAALTLAILTALACSSPTGVPEGETVSGVRYTSTPSVTSDTPFVLTDTVVIKNVGQHTKFLTFGGCPLLMRAYRSADRSGAPVYDQATHFACAAVVVGLTLAPGASKTLVGSVAAADLRAAGAPPGHYWFASVLRPSGTVIELAAGDASFGP